MNWSEQVNIYCERLDASFWSEPLNAISNAAFIIAAIYCLNRARAGGRIDFLTMLLVVILFAIGVGSFLFHTLANRWAGLADTLPIVLFILVYLFGATHRYRVLHHGATRYSSSHLLHARGGSGRLYQGH